MNNTEKVLKYGACFGKDFLVDGESVNPDWRIDEHSYHLLRNLFLQSGRDDQRHQVGLRISYLDLLYKTQLYRTPKRLIPDTYKEGGKLYDYLAGRLLELNKKDKLYTKIENGEPRAVTIIATKLINGEPQVANGIAKKLIKGREVFSFASKYCFFHNEDDYPIWDSMVIGSLNFYKGEVKKKFDEADIPIPKAHKKWTKELTSLQVCNYPLFRYVVNQFKEAFGLDVSYKELDWYLWTFGGAIGVGEKKEDREKRENKIRKDTDTILSLQE